MSEIDYEVRMTDAILGNVEEIFNGFLAGEPNRDEIVRQSQIGLRDIKVCRAKLATLKEASKQAENPVVTHG